MTAPWDREAAKAALEALREDLGRQLVKCRSQQALSQTDLARAIDRTRDLISKVERGIRALSAEQWAILDGVCEADGALGEAAGVVAQAAADYDRDRRRELQRARAEATLQSLELPPVVSRTFPVARTPEAPVLAELEALMQVVNRLARLVGRREALRLAQQTLAALTVAGLDPDEVTRMARTLDPDAPSRVDPQTVEHVRESLVHAQLLEDSRGPREVFDTVSALHGVASRLVEEGRVPASLQPRLLEVSAMIATSLGFYYVDFEDHASARRCFRYARSMAHKAESPGCGAYATSLLTMSFFLTGSVSDALDMSAVATRLAATTDDVRIQAFAHQMTAAAYAIDGNHRLLMKEADHARELLATAPFMPGSPGYWLTLGGFDSQRCLFLLYSGRPKDALVVATDALKNIPESFPFPRGMARVRRCMAATAVEHIELAAGELSEAIPVAHLAPRLARDVLRARQRLEPWRETSAVTALDAQLGASGLLVPAQSGSHRTRNLVL